MQGWRTSNEDAHITALDFVPGVSLFAVFDGHGGAEVAKFCEKHMVEELKANKDFQAQKYEEALRTVFLKIDKMLLENSAKAELQKYSKTNQYSGNGGDIPY
jgi:serine/threonine protein phosphatase PrpC